MSALRDPSFLQSVKGKVILGFVIASVALTASWYISKVTFDNVLNKVSDMSRPNDKLRMVNRIFQEIVQLDNLQNVRKIAGDELNEQVHVQTNQLVASLDSLSTMNIGNDLLIVKIDSMKSILLQRAKTYGDYVKVRSKLVNNKALEDEVKNISGLITTKQRPDSTVVKTERRTTTTTTYTEVPDSSQKAEEKKGFFNRVFGGNKKSKKNQPKSVETPKVVHKQEVNVQVDTITVANEDSTIEKVGEAVNAIQKSQKMRTSTFVDRELELATTGSSLVQQLLKIMKDVESEVLKQSNDERLQARDVVTGSINNLVWVMLGFFCMTALLAYLIFTDITKSNDYRSQLETAKEEAEYHSMAKQRFLANMSHEIRTPLQSIMGYAEALKKSDKPRKQDLDTLHSASEQLLYLVNEILDYSKIISDRFTFENRVFALNPLVNEVIKVLRPSAESKGLELRLDNLLPSGIYLNGDPFRLRQVLYNLLSNAIKFTETGEVCLRVKGVEFDNEMQIEYLVSDTGIGLSKEQVEKIFNQFEQADPSIARRYGGTGLGLSIVKALVEGMSGHIRVQSQQGKGTTFFVTTSMKKAEAMELTEEAQEKRYKINGKVWLVDDDSFILKWCSSVLEMNGIAHTAFSSAEEVLSRPWDDQVKFVLTDMRMSGMNGAELCKRLRKSALPDVKYFVLTAQALPEEKTRLLEMGFDGYLMKPFHSIDLLELLEKSSSNIDITPKSAASDHLDFDNLSKMTFGDESLMREILDQFVKDSRQDIEAISVNVRTGHLDKVQELMHRMAGRTGQIGATDLSAQFRSFEIALMEEPDSVSADDMLDLVGHAATVIGLVEEKALAYSI